MTEQIQRAIFDIHIEVTADGRVAINASGNLAPPIIYSNLGLLMRKLEQQMMGNEPQVGPKTPSFHIRKMP